jgi:hypothetical protein
MNALFFLIQWIVSDAIQPCVQCKFFKKDFWSDSKFGKCALYPKPMEDDSYFVTGRKTTQKIEYTFCSIARTDESMCGNDGKYYQKVQ